MAMVISGFETAQLKENLLRVTFRSLSRDSTVDSEREACQSLAQRGQSFSQRARERDMENGQGHFLSVEPDLCLGSIHYCI